MSEGRGATGSQSRPQLPSNYKFFARKIHPGRANIGTPSDFNFTLKGIDVIEFTQRAAGFRPARLISFSFGPVPAPLSRPLILVRSPVRRYLSPFAGNSREKSLVGSRSRDQSRFAKLRGGK